jgi:hypothetical protein
MLTVTTVARNLSGPSGDPAIAQSFDQEAAAVSEIKRDKEVPLLISLGSHVKDSCFQS